MRPVLLPLCAVLLGGCEYKDRVNRPLPEGLAVKVKGPGGGQRMERDDFVGRPWVLSLWVPG